MKKSLVLISVAVSILVLTGCASPPKTKRVAYLDPDIRETLSDSEYQRKYSVDKAECLALGEGIPRPQSVEDTDDDSKKGPVGQNFGSYDPADRARRKEYEKTKKEISANCFRGRGWTLKVEPIE